MADTRSEARFDIYDPDLYVDGPIHEIFAELRRSQPVYWQEMPGEPGYRVSFWRTRRPSSWNSVATCC
jgi:hypothetical protein